MATNILPTHSQLTDLFNYNPDTGWLTRKKKWYSQKQGERAGTLNRVTGYRYVTVMGCLLLEHRVIWFLSSGEWPSHEIDHINRIRDDNRIENLRVVTRSFNMANTPRRPGNRVGLKGVTKSYNKYRPQLMVNGKHVMRGGYGTAEEAYCAYVEKARSVFGDCHMG